MPPNCNTDALAKLAAAKTALDDLDDYARMEIGVNPIGPRGVLERFIADFAELAAESDMSDNVRERMSELLVGVAGALYGPPAAGTLHDWSLLPRRVALLKDDNLMLKRTIHNQRRHIEDFCGPAPAKLTVSQCSSAQYCAGWNECVDEFLKSRPRPTQYQD